MSTREQDIEAIRVGGSQRTESSETASAVYRSIEDLREMITALMDQVSDLSEKVDATVTTQGSLDNLRTACQLMAAKVDATATPVTSFVSTFNNNI